MNKLFNYLNLSILLLLFSKILSVEITVNSNGDDPAVNSVISSLTVSGVTTLRSAIEFANANSDSSNTINFSIPGAGVQTIDIGTGLGVNGVALPDITKPIVIDGYTQPNSKIATDSTTATILIEINGQSTVLDSDGISLAAGSDESVIRGLIINRFARNGIFILSSNNKILGNYIGTDATGTIALQNGDDGIDINNISSSGNIIGGLNPADRNLISGHQGNGSIDAEGIEIAGSDNQIIGNYIGTDVTGKNPLPNETGIDLQSSANNNIIKCNLIAFNNGIAATNGWGVVVNGGIGNSILSNSMFNNAKNSIALLNNGNNNQVAPVITSATASGSTISVSGTLSSMTNPNSVYRIEFFLNTVNQNPITYGRAFIGSVNITTNGTGDASFSTRLASTAIVGQFISATATLLNGTTATSDTSEYSFNKQFTQGPEENALSTAIFAKYSNKNKSFCDL